MLVKSPFKGDFMAKNEGCFKKGLIPWNKGLKTPENVKKKQSERAIGRKHSDATKQKMSKTRSTGIRRLSVSFKEWRKKVFERDGYKCLECGNEQREKLHPHHVIPFKDSIQLRFELSNGRTLCAKCHGKLEGFQKGHIPWTFGKKITEESRKKMSEAKKGKPSPNKGRKRSIS